MASRVATLYITKSISLEELTGSTTIINPRRACAERVTVVVSCVCVSVCLSEHAILAVRAVRSITKDAIMLNVRFAAILKRRFS